VCVDAAVEMAICKRMRTCKQRITKVAISRYDTGVPITGGIQLTLNPAYMKVIMNLDDGDGVLSPQEIDKDKEAVELAQAVQLAVCDLLGPSCRDPSVIHFEALTQGKA